MVKKPKPDVEGLLDLARNRVAIEEVTPCINGGRFPAKGVVGRRFAVEASRLST